MQNLAKQRLRFSPEDDLCFLREVIVQNPFADSSRWEMIRKHMAKATGKMFSLRTLKDHIDYLLKLFSRDDWSNRKKSGTEKQYNEKDSLLQDVNDLARAFRSKRSGKAPLKNDFPENAMYNESCSSSSSNAFYTTEAIDEATAETIAPFVTITSPSLAESEILNLSRMRKRRKESGLEYLRKRNVAELEVRKRGVELEERKLNLEEAKFQLERSERLKRLELEVADREARLLIVKQQQETISSLIKDYPSTHDQDLRPDTPVAPQFAQTQTNTVRTPPPLPQRSTPVPIPEPESGAEDEEILLKWNHYDSNMKTTFSSLLQRNQFVDVTLCSEGQIIKCHKLILSACSEFFEEILNGISPLQHPVIFLNGTPFAILQALIDFMYLGELHIEQTKLKEILKVADALKIKGLFEETVVETTVPDEQSDQPIVTLQSKRKTVSVDKPLKKPRPDPAPNVAQKTRPSVACAEAAPHWDASPIVKEEPYDEGQLEYEEMELKYDAPVFVTNADDSVADALSIGRSGESSLTLQTSSASSSLTRGPNRAVPPDEIHDLN